MIKKRKAFTLAEVLITLTIIGVIAALTIPALLVNLEKQGDYSKLLKAVSVIDNAASQVRLDNGGSLAGLASTSLDFANLFAPKMSYVKFCANQTDSPNCYLNWSDDMYNLQGGFIAGLTPYPYQNYPKMLFADGSVYIFQLDSSDCQHTRYTENGSPQNCGLVYVDTNGKKAPNTWGKDIFLIYINDHNVIAAGNSKGNSPASLCALPSANNWNGVTCAGRAIVEGGIKYY